MKKTSSFDNIFTFKEPEKSLKKNPLGLFSWWEILRAWKNQKRTQTFDTRFQERDQSVVTNAHRLFPFYGSLKKS